VRLLIPVPLFDRAISFLCGTGLAQIFGWAIPQSLELWLTPGLLLAGHFLSKGFREVVSPPEKMAQLRWGMLCLWLILGLIHSGCALWPGQGISSLEGAKVRGAGSILSVKELAAGPGAGPRQQWVVQLQRQDAEGAEQTRLWLKQERVLLTLQWPTASGQAMDGQAAGPADYIPGAEIAFSGSISIPQAPRNPGAFDYPAYLAAQKLYCMVEVTPANLRCLQPASLPARWMEGLRLELHRQIRRYLPDQEAGIVEGCLLGQTFSMAEEDLAAYRRSGIAHLFAVSGSHGSMILSLAAYLHWLCPGRRSFWRRWFLSAGMLFFYSALTGFPLSMMRTLVMGILLLTAPAFGRQHDGKTALAIAVMLLLWHDPGSLQTAGFQLSFGVVLGIYRLAGWLKRTRLPGCFAVPVAAQLAGMPLQAFWFNQLQPAGALINFAVMILMGPLMVFSLAAGCLSQISEVLASGLWKVCGLFAWMMHSLSSAWADAPWACWPMAGRPWPFYILWAILLWLLPELPYYEAALGNCLGSRRRQHWMWRKRRRILGMLTAGLCLGLWLMPTDLEVVYLDVGEGDCIVIHTPNRKTWLIDGGGTVFSDYKTGTKTVLPYLRYRGVRSLEGILLTHHHEDHREGITQLLGAVPVKTLWMPPLPPTEDKDASQTSENADREFLAALKRAGVEAVTLDSPSRQIPMEIGLKLTLWWPPAMAGVHTEAWQGNNQSLIISLEQSAKGHFSADARRPWTAGEQPGFRWLFTGDAENLSLKTLMDNLPADALRADFLKLPHHGSRTSYCPAFYEAVRPGGAVSTGGRQRTGNLATEVEAWFEKAGIPLWQTRRQGAVRTRRNAAGIEIRTVLP